MTDSRMVTGVRVGVVAAAIMIGAVIGLGLRHGLATRPFLTAGYGVLETLGVRAVSRGAAPIAVGLVAVALAIIVLGVCFTFVAASLRGLRLLAVALLFAASAWAVYVYIVPSILVPSDGIELGTGQRVFLFTLLALGLAVGMRLARPDVRVE
jgi:hypothetical protein